jgi:transposase
LRALQDWALNTPALPESALGKAIAYMGHVWEGLRVFLDDPNVELDNNRTERALRGVVVGRKNHCGSRSRRGTEVAALLYSLIESAKLADVEPRAYLHAAVEAALSRNIIRLPHELAARS